jgi:hypothetical protein
MFFSDSRQLNWENDNRRLARPSDETCDRNDSVNDPQWSTPSHDRVCDLVLTVYRSDHHSCVITAVSTPAPVWCTVLPCCLLAVTACDIGYCISNGSETVGAGYSAEFVWRMRRAAAHNIHPCVQYGAGSTFLNLKYFKKYRSNSIHTSVVNRKQYKVCECLLEMLK